MNVSSLYGTTGVSECYIMLAMECKDFVYILWLLNGKSDCALIGALQMAHISQIYLFIPSLREIAYGLQVVPAMTNFSKWAQYDKTTKETLVRTTSYLRLDALDDVTTVPALAVGGLPSAVVAKLLLGENAEDTSESALPRFPKHHCHIHYLIYYQLLVIYNSFWPIKFADLINFNKVYKAVKITFNMYGVLTLKTFLFSYSKISSSIKTFFDSTLKLEKEQRGIITKRGQKGSTVKKETIL